MRIYAHTPRISSRALDPALSRPRAPYPLFWFPPRYGAAIPASSTGRLS